MKSEEMRFNLSKVTDSRQRIQTQVCGADVVVGVYENSLQTASVCLSSAEVKSLDEIENEARALGVLET